MTKLRKILMVCMLAGFVIGLSLFHGLLYLVPLSFWQIIYLLCNMAIIPDILLIARNLVDRTILKRK